MLSTLLTRFRRVRATILLFGLAGCSQINDILDVPPPSNIKTDGELSNKAGAEMMLAGAKDDLFQSLISGFGLMGYSLLLSDEFSSGARNNIGTLNAVDSRHTTYGAISNEPTSSPLASLLWARSKLLIAYSALLQFEPANDQRKAGEAIAWVGYAELLLAEWFCAGTVLDRALPGGGLEYARPLTTDSLFATAATHFAAAAAHASQDAELAGFARLGLGRALLGRGKYAEAAAAVADVPSNFLYDIQTVDNQANGGFRNLFLNASKRGSTGLNMSDGEGGNGLNYLTARDPRVLNDTTIGRTSDRASRIPGAGPLYYPMKFGVPSTSFPIATGVEARLIEAEAALRAGDIGTWETTLNALRSDASSTYLRTANAMPPLTADSTSLASSAMQVDVHFRERAFWLFGMGIRLGDMRRLIRQYNRSPATVYPRGTYLSGTDTRISDYGDDVSFTLPTQALTTNPHYRGCLTSPRDG